MTTTTGREGLRDDLNVTPLVDVVLVLLIIFMVLAPLARLGHEVRVPPTAVGAGTASAPPLVRLARDGSLFLDAERLVPEELPRRLRAVLATRGAAVTLVAASGELPYARVASLVEACKAAGADGVGIVLGEPSGS